MNQLKRVGQKEELLDETLFVFTIYVSQRAKRARIEIRPGENRIIIPRFARNRSRLVRRIVRAKKNWIINSLAKNRSSCKFEKLPQKYKQKYYSEAKKIVLTVIDKYQLGVNFNYNSITIRDQKTRWGSCSAKGNLSFNWRIIKLPKPLQEYIIIHELVHLKHLNHSQDFWQELELIYPKAKQSKKLLKKHPIC